MEAVDYSEKRCFIITPVGGDNSEIRRAADGVIDAAIFPVLIDLGFKMQNIIAPHRMTDAGSITSKIIEEIMEVDLVIANLTGLNPNVMYELAIRHAARKPILPICEVGINLPFDIIDQRTIFFVNDIKGSRDLQIQLKEKIPTVLKDDKPDNPIYRVIDNNLLKQNKEAQIPAELVLERMESMEKTLNVLRSSINHVSNVKVYANTNESMEVDKMVNFKDIVFTDRDYNDKKKSIIKRYIIDEIDQEKLAK